MEELRRSLTKVGGDYKVYKNTLVRRAARDAGLEILEPMLEGPTAIAFVDGDVAQVAKVLRDFARTNPNLIVKGGLLGQNLLDARRAAALADLPSREVLLAQIAGILAAPLQKFAGLLQAVPARMAYALSALIEERRKSEPTEVPAPAAAAPEAAADAAAPDAAAPDAAAPEAEAPEAATDAPVEAVAEDAAPAEATDEATVTTTDEPPAAEETAAEDDASA
jgi:large subunit ribosomal protein L10